MVPTPRRGKPRRHITYLGNESVADQEHKKTQQGSTTCTEKEPPAEVIQQPCQTEGKSNQATKQDSKSPTNKRERFREFLKRWELLLHLIVPSLFSAVVIIVIAVQAWIYSCQLGEMKKSTDAATRAAKAAEDSVVSAKDSSHAELRAWVLVVAAGLNVPIKANTPITVSVVFVNEGKTPASEVDTEWWTTISTEENPKNFPRNEPLGAPSKGVLAPSVPFTGVSIPPMVLTDAQITPLSKGGKYYVYGIVTYKDVFGERHKTEFCLAQYPVGGILFAPHTEGNYIE